MKHFELRKETAIYENNFFIIIVVVGKFLDAVILSKEQDTLVTSLMQFGFNENMPTHCKYVVQETIKQFHMVHMSNAGSYQVCNLFLIQWFIFSHPFCLLPSQTRVFNGIPMSVI